MIVSGSDFEVVFLVAVAMCVVAGLWTLWAVRDAYEQLGGGELALDVPDRGAPAALESPAGQAELQQLLDAIAVVRRTRAEGEPGA